MILLSAIIDHDLLASMPFYEAIYRTSHTNGSGDCEVLQAEPYKEGTGWKILITI